MMELTVAPRNSDLRPSVRFEHGDHGYDLHDPTVPAKDAGSGPLGETGAILGGTGYIGPHLVRLAVSRGHKVTTFTRGRRKPELPPGVIQLIGDRNGQLQALEGKAWDAVIDDSAGGLGGGEVRFGPPRPQLGGVQARHQCGAPPVRRAPRATPSTRFFDKTTRDGFAAAKGGSGRRAHGGGRGGCGTQNSKPPQCARLRNRGGEARVPELRLFPIYLSSVLQGAVFFEVGW
jgi:hypothetical protein